VVLDRSVEQGQTVAASFNTPTLFTIANDLKKMQVEANVDEADIGQVRVGQQVLFTVDAYSEETFAGVVNQIRLQPTVTNNVVTYTVIVEAPNPEEKLFPGMTASITIITRSERGVVVPVEALNFQPGTGVEEPLPAGVWVRTAGGIARRELQTGLSDGVNVIAREGLTPGDTVILSVQASEQKSTGQPSNPFMPQPPRRR
jgi:HlyD family secretion protein